MMFRSLIYRTGVACEEVARHTGDVSIAFRSLVQSFHNQFQQPSSFQFALAHNNIVS
eukprot:Awhi_evm1s5301